MKLLFFILLFFSSIIFSQQKEETITFLNQFIEINWEKTFDEFTSKEFLQWERSQNAEKILLKRLEIIDSIKFKLTFNFNKQGKQIYREIYCEVNTEIGEKLFKYFNNTLNSVFGNPTGEKSLLVVKSIGWEKENFTVFFTSGGIFDKYILDIAISRKIQNKK